MKTKSLFCALAALAVGSVVAGNACTWTGRGADAKWSTAANWDVAPVSGNGDTLIFATAAESVNDVADFSIAAIHSSGGAQRISGERIAFANGGVAISNSCPVVYDAPLYGMKNTTFSFLADDSTFNGRVTVGATAHLYFKGNGTGARIFVNGGIDSANQKGTLHFEMCQNNSSSTPFFVNSPIRVATVYWCGEWKNVTGYLTVPGSEWNVAYTTYGYCRAGCENAWCTNGVISWSSYYTAAGYWDLNGHDQTVDRINSLKVPINNDGTYNDSQRLGSDEPATLTMRATASDVCHGVIEGKVSLVYAPLGDFTETFSNRVCTTAGDIVVSNGTFAVVGAGKFANVPRIKVCDGAAFDLASTASGALAGLRELTLEGTGEFRLAASAASPFGASTVVRLASTAKLALAENASATVAALVLDGTPLADGTYRKSAENTWIEGAGEIVVDSTASASAVWKNAVDGVLTDGSKWLGGAPSASRPAVVDVAGAYSISVPDATSIAYGLTIGAGADSMVTLTCAGSFTQSASRLTVARGGRLEIPEGASFTYLKKSDAAVGDKMIVVEDGGEILVNGGTFSVPDLRGAISVGGGMGRPGRISVTNGTFELSPYVVNAGSDQTAHTLNLVDGGTLAVGGTGTFRVHSPQWGARVVESLDGNVELYGDGRFVTDQKFTTLCLSGKFSMRDNSVLTTELGTDTLQIRMPQYNGANMRAKRHPPLEMTVADHAAIRFTVGAFSFCTADWLSPFDGRAKLTITSDAQNFLGGKFYVGVTRGYSEVESAGADVYVGAYGLYVGMVNQDLHPNADSASTGMVHVVGGSFAVDGKNSRSKTVGQPCGIVAGYGLPTSKFTLRYRGEFVVDGGVVSNEAGHVVLGGGVGEGYFTQNGGVYESQSTKHVSIGFAGARGEWKMAGGVANLASDVWVGGSPTNLFAGVCNFGTFDYQPGAAQGLLRVTGGEFTTTENLIVSGDGAGAVEIGAAGRVSCADFALSNGVSTLSFEFGAAGAGAIAASGKFVVAPGSKLVVDASKLDASATRRRSFHLVSCASREGAFADGDVTLELPDTGVARTASLTQEADGVWLRIPVGTAIIVR